MTNAEDKPTEEKPVDGTAPAEDVVTPWTVGAASASGVDYEKLLHRFGCQPITGDIVERIERLTGKPAHHLLRRGMYFAHRDLNIICDMYEKGKKFYLYTGRGPSSTAMHLGHSLQFLFTKYLQEAFDVPLVIQMTDDEKYLWKDMTVEESQKLAADNIKDIIALGFNPDKTFIFNDFDFIGTCPAFYQNIMRIAKRVNFNQATKIFGFDGDSSIGKVVFPAVEAAPCFTCVTFMQIYVQSRRTSFPFLFEGHKDMMCLVPCAIDQDPYFRMSRDVAPRLGLPKPCMMYSTFLPALQGSQTKMSASDATSSIFLTDTAKQVKTKVNKHAFSGGRDTTEEHRKYGGNCAVDVAYIYMTYLCDDDERLAKLKKDYESGELLTGFLKKELIDTINEILAEFQANRKDVTDEKVAEFTKLQKFNMDF